ncbi:hypothetical protein [Vibrio superstes]|uniref:C-type lysozyme inhibitor domain-containing protein n=1 Tax=Vibrio superstes NBRC 103154 TaxID=1219062 RepID=A0A511QTK3_9VIBR|nr:hypothetical protein [Vibrio superstes]GEM80661.1 hypothetical protein VSU01S_29060 [Vibrio superstes NBRC 103154]
MQKFIATFALLLSSVSVEAKSFNFEDIFVCGDTVVSKLSNSTFLHYKLGESIAPNGLPNKLNIMKPRGDGMYESKVRAETNFQKDKHILFGINESNGGAFFGDALDKKTKTVRCFKLVQ